MFASWLLRIAAAQFAAYLERLAEHTDSDCVRQLTNWIESGTLDDAWERDPKATALCLIESALTLGLALIGKYHDHNPDIGLPVKSVVGSGPNAISIGPMQIDNCLSLAKALGIADEPCVTAARASTADAAVAKIDPLLLAALVEVGKLILKYFLERRNA